MEVSEMQKHPETDPASFPEDDVSYALFRDAFKKMKKMSGFIRIHRIIYRRPSNEKESEKDTWIKKKCGGWYRLIPI